MAESLKGMARCACGAVGGVVDRAGRFEFKEDWFVVEHEGGSQHKVKVVDVEGKFRFKLVEGTR